MKKSALSLALINLLVLPPVGWSQEEKDLPSQKTREAVEKFKQGPATIGKSLEALKEAGKAKLQETQTKESAAPAKTAGEGVALPEKKPEQPQSPRYSSAGRRDPFQPMQLRARAPVTKRPENLSPLERYDVGQLKLVAIIWNTKEPRAMVEDAAGLGFIVKVGTPIGANEGKVKEIKPTEVVIEESFTDFYGARKNRAVSMKLPVE